MRCVTTSYIHSKSVELLGGMAACILVATRNVAAVCQKYLMIFQSSKIVI